jgi:hypothetical protein
MIYITQNNTNEIYVNVSEFKTLSSPTYLWRLQNCQSRVIKSFIPENITSSTPNSYANKYDVFSFTTNKSLPENLVYSSGNAANIHLEDENQYWLSIYESVSPTSLNPSGEKLLTDLAFIFVPDTSEYYTGNTATTADNVIYYRNGVAPSPTPSITPTSTLTPTPTPSIT